MVIPVLFWNAFFSMYGNNFKLRIIVKPLEMFHNSKAVISFQFHWMSKILLHSNFGTQFAFKQTWIIAIYCCCEYVIPLNSFWNKITRNSWIKCEFHEKKRMFHTWSRFVCHKCLLCSQIQYFNLFVFHF